MNKHFKTVYQKMYSLRFFDTHQFGKHNNPEIFQKKRKQTYQCFLKTVFIHNPIEQINLSRKPPNLSYKLSSDVNYLSSQPYFRRSPSPVAQVQLCRARIPYIACCIQNGRLQMLYCFTMNRHCKAKPTQFRRIDLLAGLSFPVFHAIRPCLSFCAVVAPYSSHGPGLTR